MNYTYIELNPKFNSDVNYQQVLQKSLKKFDISLDFSCDMAFSSNGLKTILGICPNNLIICKLSNDYDMNIALKNTICECFNSFLVKNTACSFAIESYLRLTSNQIDNPKNFENESLIPEGAEPITSDLGFVQGYMINYKNINFIFLPPDINQLKDIIDNKLPLIFSRLYKTPTEFIYLKTFGLSEEILTKMLLPFTNNSMDVLIRFDCYNLDSLITIGYDKRMDRVELDQFVAQICETLKKYLYATEDIEIEKVALDLISFTNKKVALFESVTKGGLYYNLSLQDSQVVNNNILSSRVVYDISNLNDLSTIDKNIIGQKGLNSVESTYEITTAMINELDVNLAICSLGNYDKYSKNLQCFLSVGDTDGVHIYKSSYKGEISDLQDIVIKNTCFYIIRKLKQNNLMFDQTI